MYDPRIQDPSPAVKVIKWLSIMQLICSLVVFILVLVLFAVDFHGHKPGLVFSVQILMAVFLCLLGMGAGIAGCKMSRYNSMEHNLTYKTLTVSMSAMTLFAALFFIIFAGTISFYDADKNDLSERTNNYRAAFGMVVAIFIVGFFQMIFAIFVIIVTVLANRSSSQYERGMVPYIPHEYISPYITKSDRSRPYMRGMPPKQYDSYERYGRGNIPY